MFRFISISITMATKRVSLPQEKSSTKLIVGKEVLKESLSSMIKLGEEIFNRQVQTMGQLDISKRDFYDLDGKDISFLIKKQYFLMLRQIKISFRRYVFSDTGDIIIKLVLFHDTLAGTYRSVF
jgi:phage FluMu protein gp41